MNIIIVSKYFAPENRIASIRSTKISKYLRELTDNKITVITIKEKDNMLVDDILKADIEKIDEIIRIKESSWVFKLNNKISKYTSTERYATNYRTVKQKKDKLTIKEKAKKNVLIWLRFFIDWAEDLNFYHNAKKYLTNNSLKYDVIFSTYGPYSSHYIGRHLKKNNKSSIWIADFRDPVYNSTIPFFFRNYSKNFVGRICKKADAITGVSQGTIDWLFLKDKKLKFVISNGYDKNDLNKLLSKKTNEIKCKLTFTYAGQLYMGKRDFSAFFKAIRELIDEKKVIKENITVNYAGYNFDELINQSIKFDMQDCLENFGYITREESLKLQLNCDILLLASWNEVNSTGIITGKFLEYLMIEKPVLSIISGNLSNSELKSIINKTNIGFCFEQANEDKNEFENLKNYILRQYENKMNGKELIFSPNFDEIKKYDYMQITKEIINLYEKL